MFYAHVICRFIWLNKFAAFVKISLPHISFKAIQRKIHYRMKTNREDLKYNFEKKTRFFTRIVVDKNAFYPGNWKMDAIRQIRPPFEGA